MRKISRERVGQLAREILESMVRTKSVTLLRERDAVHQAIATVLADEFRREDEREETVRRRIATIRKPPARGTREYEDLFRQYMEEEYLREGLDS